MGLEKVKGEGGGIKMSFSLFERHVTPCPSNPVKLDFSAIVRRFFNGAFRIFLSRFIKFRTEELFDIFERKLWKKFMTFPRFSFSLVAIMEALDPIYRN